MVAYYYTRDHLGSVREMTDSSGTIHARYDYDPYGRVTTITGTVPSDFQYAGMYEHAPSGLNLTKYRAYDPTMGRWLSRDPLPYVEVLQGPNLYQYVANDPLNIYDPLGLRSDATSTVKFLAAHVHADTGEPIEKEIQAGVFLEWTLGTLVCLAPELNRGMDPPGPDDDDGENPPPPIKPEDMGIPRMKITPGKGVTPAPPPVPVPSR